MRKYGIALLFVLLMPLAIVVAQNEVELAWRDTGYDLAAGYRYTISLESHCNWGQGCAKALISAGPLRVQLDGSHLKIWVNGELEYDSDVGSEAITINIVVDCDGSGYLVLDDGTRIGFSIDRSYRIMKYEERICFLWNCKESKVAISRQRIPCSQTIASLRPIESAEDKLKQVDWKAVGVAAGIGVLVLSLLLLAPRNRKLVVVAIAIGLAVSIGLNHVYAQDLDIDRDVAAEDLMYNSNLDKAVVVVRYGGQYGTGWWVNSRYIVTAAHVVGYTKGAEVTIIKAPYGVRGEVVYIDRDRDIAIVRVDRSMPNIKTLPLCKHVFKGQEIVVIGYPYELLLVTGSLEKMSKNPRAAFGEIRWIDNEKKLAEVGASTDAGNSGGPVVDAAKLCVVGIITKALIGRAATLYFATTADAIKQALDEAGVPYELSMNFVDESIATGVDVSNNKLFFLVLGLGATVLVLIGVVIGMAMRGGRR